MSAPAYFADPRPDVQAVVAAPGARILDVGCGEGALGAALKRAGARSVVGIEVDARAASSARAALDAVALGDAATVEVPGADEPFDWIIFADVLEHLPDPDRVLRRMLAYLAPGGAVVVSVPNFRFWAVLVRLVVDRWSYTDAGVRDRTHLRVFTRRSALAMVRAAGLEVERLDRRYRLVEDQSEIGRVGALATRIVAAVAPRSPLRELFCFQYVIVARPGA